MTGCILKVIATVKYPPVIPGVEAKLHALLWELTFPVSTAKRKMCMFKIYMAENVLGWA